MNIPDNGLRETKAGKDQHGFLTTGELMPNGIIRLFCYGSGMSRLVHPGQLHDLLTAGRLHAGEAWDVWSGISALEC